MGDLPHARHVHATSDSPGVATLGSVSKVFADVLRMLPTRPSTPAPATDRVRVVAHRGASAEVPENTLAAVRRAVSHDADMVEVDVQRTRDGVLVVHHDTTLARTTDVRRVYPDRAPWSLGDFTFEELRRLDAGSWRARGSGFAGERVPSLLEVMEVLAGTHTGLLLEVKSPSLYPGIATDVAQVLRHLPGGAEAAGRQGRLVVQSFDIDVARRIKGEAPAVPVAVLGRPSRRRLRELAEWACQVNPSHKVLDRGYVEDVHRLGMGCMTWTVNAPAAMARAASLGVDGIITDRPALLQRRLRSDVPAERVSR